MAPARPPEARRGQRWRRLRRARQALKANVPVSRSPSTSLATRGTRGCAAGSRGDAAITYARLPRGQQPDSARLDSIARSSRRRRRAARRAATARNGTPHSPRETPLRRAWKRHRLRVALQNQGATGRSETPHSARQGETPQDSHATRVETAAALPGPTASPFRAPAERGVLPRSPDGIGRPLASLIAADQARLLLAGAASKRAATGLPTAPERLPPALPRMAKRVRLRGARRKRDEANSSADRNDSGYTVRALSVLPRWTSRVQIPSPAQEVQ
jgi:hypothetical protein